jgi:hypothetical protein
MMLWYEIQRVAGVVVLAHDRDRQECHMVLDLHH